MLILHGDDIVTSRSHLNETIEKARLSEQEIRRLAGSFLDLTGLTQLLEGLNLFGKEPLLVIEGVFSLPKSKNKDNLLDFLSRYQDRSIILYESKALTPTPLKLFPRAEIREHKPAAIIFTFLESLRPGGVTKSLKLLSDLEKTGEPTELIFAMLVRQVRLLIQALEPNSLKMTPWQKNRLTSQAQLFGEEKLLSLHHRLYHVDKELKTGKNSLPLSLQIFNLIANL